MLPQIKNNVEILGELEEVRHPNLTYRMNIEEETVAGNVTDDLKAVQQACYKILNTERYQFVIYSWNYGVELMELFGKPLPYVYSELPRRIREALLGDDRVIEVGEFSVSHKKNDVFASFKVTSIYGDFRMEKGVQIG